MKCDLSESTLGFVNTSQSSEKYSCAFRILPDGSGATIYSVAVDAGSTNTPSAQCTDAMDKAIDLHLQHLSTGVLIPLYGAMVRPHVE